MAETATTWWSASSDFRLGGGQWDHCPHRHRTPEAAASCGWWDRWGGVRAVVRRRRDADGREWVLGCLADVGHGGRSW